ncbi:ABCA12, partial [Symbiodinium necroappetens]
MPRRPVRRKDADLFIEDETDTFKDAVRAGKLSTVQEMLGAVSEDDAGCWCCEALDNFGRTALHHVLAGPDQEQILLLARFLCRQRADPNASDENGVTPLHLAAQRGSKHVIRSLLCARADNQQRTSDGRSTVDFAQFNPSPVEAFEVVGWPGKGPELHPLEPKKAKPQGAATEDELDARVNNLLYRLGLDGQDADRKAVEYSGGMKRKLSLAIALIGRSPLLFLDEPSAAVDAGAKRHLWKVIRMRSRDQTVVLTTHSMEE